MRAALLGAAALAGMLAAGHSAAAPRADRVARITYYEHGAVTYSGAPVGPGVAACSWNIPLYAHVTIDGWYTVQCLDRGALGDADWIDVFGGPWVTDTFGDYASIEVW